MNLVSLKPRPGAEQGGLQLEDLRLLQVFQFLALCLYVLIELGQLLLEPLLVFLLARG